MRWIGFRTVLARPPPVHISYVMVNGFVTMLCGQTKEEEKEKG
jgi:hypothetical protein